MNPQVATVVSVIGVLGLYFWDREKDVKTSFALWIPTAWMIIIGSRPVTQWFSTEPVVDSAAQLMDGSPVDRSVYSALMFVALVVLIARPSKTLTVVRRNVPILLFFGYCLVSAIWSDYPDVSAKRWVKDLGDLLMVMVMLTDPNPLAALKRLLTRVGLLLATFSILFVKYFPTLGRNYSPWTGEAFYTGVTTNKQGLGMIMLIFGLGAIWQLVFLYRAKEAPHRWRHMLVQAVLFGEVMWLSRRAQSMTSMATFFMVGFMVLLIGLYQWARKPMFVHFYVASATFVTVLALFLSPSSGLVEKLGRNSTLTGRTEIWNLVLNMPINRLLGTGFESFWLGDRLQYIWNLYWWHPNEAHNGYIEILLNLGWIGLALLAIIMVSGYAKVARRLRSDAEVNSIRLAYLFVALIYAFTEAAFRMLTFTWVFLLFAAATGVEAIDPTAQMLPATERPLKPPQIANVEHPVWLGRRRSI